VFDAMSSKVIM